MTITWRRQWLYPLVGGALALGAPIGLAILHAVEQGTAPEFGWVADEVRTHSGDYLYLTIATLLAFILFGWFIGKQDDRLQAGALTDPLTGLWNRRYLADRLKQELDRSARYRTPLSFLLIDVDCLKDINDRGGHGAGDDALKLIAQAITRSCRAIDVAARYGGDEFAVLAPSTSGADAVGLAQRIRVALAASRVGGQPVTVSVGVADLTDAPSLEATELSRAADRALYKAKAGGRDRVARLGEAPSNVIPLRGNKESIDPGRLRLRVCVRHVYSGDGKMTGDMRVFCPDKDHSVSVDECLGCPNWSGLYLEQKERDSYLQCSPRNRGRANGTTRDAYDRSRISAIMTPSVVCVRPDLSVQAVLDIFLERHISGAPVVNESGKLLGVISKTDLLNAKNLAIDIDDPERVPKTVDEAMTPLGFALHEHASISQAAGLMAAEGIHRVVVVSPDGQVVGIVSALDVLRWLAERDGYVKSSTLAVVQPPAAPTVETSP